MTRSMTAPLVHIRKLGINNIYNCISVRVTHAIILETKDKVRPETVLQQTGDNVDMSRRFSDVRGNLAKRSVRNLSSLRSDT